MSSKVAAKTIDSYTSSSSDSEDEVAASPPKKGVKGGKVKRERKKKTKKKKKTKEEAPKNASGGGGLNGLLNIVIFVPLLTIACIEGLVAAETKVWEEDDGRSAGAVLKPTRTSRRGAEPRHVKKLNPADFAQLFRRSKAPMLSEMKGEFKAEPLSLGVQRYAPLSKLYANNFFGTGTWKAVGFGSVGKGYNTFLQRSGKRERTRRFTYYLGKSTLVDEGHSALMYYESSNLNVDFNKALVCEVREVNENMYVGYAYMRWNTYTVFPFVIHRPETGMSRDVDFESESYTFFNTRVPLDVYWAKLRGKLPKWVPGYQKYKEPKTKTRASSRGRGGGKKKKAKKSQRAKKPKQKKKARKRRNRNDNDDL